MIPAFQGIYGIIDTALGCEPEALCDAMLAGGIRIVQLRAKAGVDRALVRTLAARTRAADAVLVVNDDFEAALDAGGWHAGQEDLAGRDPRADRAALGTRLFGVSCDAPDLARAAHAFGADYAGVGPFAATATKDDAGGPIGFAGVAAVVRASALPVVAIGGITLANLREVKATGAAMAAVVSAIARAEDSERAARDLVAAWAAP